MDDGFEVIGPISRVQISRECLQLVTDLVNEHGSALYHYKPARWLGLDANNAGLYAQRENAYKNVTDDLKILENGNICPLGSQGRCLTTERKVLLLSDAIDNCLETIGPVTAHRWHAEESGTTLTRNHFHDDKSHRCEYGSVELYPLLEHQLARSKTPNGQRALSLLGQGTEEILLLRVPGKDRRGISADIWTTITSVEDVKKALAAEPDASLRSGWGWSGLPAPTITDGDLPSQGRFHARHVEDGNKTQVKLWSGGDEREFSVTLIRPGWTLGPPDDPSSMAFQRG